MNRIDEADLIKYDNEKIYKYQIFQIHVFAFNLNQDWYKGAIFYKTYEDARKKQALDLHRLLNKTYMASDAREKAFIEYFQMYIDHRDIDFYLKSVTNNQLNEEEYWKIIKQISITHPEKLI